MKKNYLLMCLCLLAGSFAGCSDDDNGPTWKELYDKEQAAIKDFMKDKSPKDSIILGTSINGVKINPVAYVFNYSEDANKKKPKDGQFILVNYTDRNLGGSILDDTRSSVIGGEKIELPKYPMGGPVYEEIIDDKDIFSIFFKYFSEGTSGSIILPSVLNFSTTYLYREYKVEKVIEGSLLDYEYELIDKYLEKKGFDKKKLIQIPAIEENDTITQIVKLIEKPSGDEILVSDSVTVYGSGYILDEVMDKENLTNRKLFEDEEATWKVSGLIQGMKDALLKMKVGEKACILIPSGRGYGKGILNYYYQYVFPPYATLAYEIEIKSKKANDK